VLASAALHAGWNTLIAAARDTHATMAVAVLAGVIAMAPVAALTWEMDASAWPYVVASAAFELGYFALLASAYASGAGVTAVYPIARGAAPVLALAVSVAFLAAKVSTVQAAGVVLVAAGVLAVRGLRRPEGRAVPLALAVAACITGYTLVDDRGVEHASATAYFEAALVLGTVPYALAVARRSGLAAVRAAVEPRAVLAGVAMATAYLLILLALERAQAAPVAALRETSIVMAVLAAAAAGRSRVTAARLAGAVAVTAGAAAIVAG
jgi:uncharacterized membrane protein